MKSRLFALTWDNARLPVGNADSRYGKISAEGVQFTNGAIAIDLGTTWESMADMKQHFQWHGNCVITWDDGQIETIGGDVSSMPWRKRYRTTAKPA
jgi:hypothetical protein